MADAVSDQARWRQLIRAAQATPPTIVTAEIYLGRIGSVWEPVLVECDDLRRYYVKGEQCGRVLVTEHIVGRVGAAIGAPVAEVTLVDVPAELVQLNPRLDDFAPGIGHGSLRIDEAFDSREIFTYDNPENVERFGKLAALYGLFIADDHQFLYENAVPYLVWSFDHSEFLPGGAEWTVFSLNAATEPTFDVTLVQGAQLSREALAAGARALADLTDTAIAMAVAAPPDSWGITIEDRVALAGFISRRRATLMTLAASSAS